MKQTNTWTGDLDQMIQASLVLGGILPWTAQLTHQGMTGEWVLGDLAPLPKSCTG